MKKYRNHSYHFIIFKGKYFDLFARFSIYSLQIYEKDAYFLGYVQRFVHQKSGRNQI